MKKETVSIDIELIRKKVRQELSPEEEQHLEQWLLASEANRAYYEKARFYYQTKGVFNKHKIDKVQAWKNYLNEHPKVSKQYICNRNEFKNYELFGVPRFIVIDKEGNFIDAFAPAPSNPDFETLIAAHI